jgi:2-polyprenyl-3-methyl-5-hydroxy-6-metoxy-1,4-benzoquinol methylase
LNHVRERLGPDFSGRRIADIGCLEGYFSIECALQGAEVLGIDGKLLNVRKCEFVRSVLGVERVVFVLGDAMKVTRESFGRFDAVLALGLLYHLDDPYTLVANAAGLCDGFIVIDTHIALENQPEIIKETGGAFYASPEKDLMSMNNCMKEIDEILEREDLKREHKAAILGANARRFYRR